MPMVSRVNVRFTPKRRHWGARMACPLCAKSGLSSELRATRLSDLLDFVFRKLLQRRCHVLDCAHIRFTKYLRSKRALEPHLLVLAVVENACDGSLQTLRHFMPCVISPVPIFDQSHQCSHENAHRVIPPG